jgi:hypothetical protein
MDRGKRAAAEAVVAVVVVSVSVVSVLQKTHVDVFIKKEHGIRIAPKQMKIK